MVLIIATHTMLSNSINHFYLDEYKSEEISRKKAKQ